MFQRQGAILKDLYFALLEDGASGLKHVEILHVMCIIGYIG